MPGKRIAGIAAIVVVTATVLILAWVFLRPDPKSNVSPLPPEQARPSAERACGLMRDFEGMVKSNAQADLALDTLDKAAVESNRAMRGDVVWVRLDSGIRAVRAGFKKNDGRAAGLGITVVREICSEFAPPGPTP